MNKNHCNYVSRISWSKSQPHKPSAHIRVQELRERVLLSALKHRQQELRKRWKEGVAFSKHFPWWCKQITVARKCSTRRFACQRCSWFLRVFLSWRNPLSWLIQPCGIQIFRCWVPGEDRQMMGTGQQEVLMSSVQTETVQLRWGEAEAKISGHRLS